jgi:hypothetical protein
MFLAVGPGMTVAWSETGVPEVPLDEFTPISDIYRARSFCSWNGYLFLAGMYELVTGTWIYYPRRIRNPAPGTVDDFTAAGAYFSDLPGAGKLLDCEALEGGIALAESSQLSLITDGGSLSLPWVYHENVGQGLAPISNFASVNGRAYIVCSDGLIYEISTGGVTRIPGFFDLTMYDDFNPGTESVQLVYDLNLQKLVVFRKSEELEEPLVPSPSGLFDWDFTDTAIWKGGSFNGQTDQYNSTFDYSEGTDDSNNLWVLETNDGEQMLAVNQQNAGGGYKGYNYSDPQTGIAALKFRLQVDISANDSGHRVQLNFYPDVGDYVHFYVMGTGILQVWKPGQVLINVPGLNGDGPRTICGYITGTHIYVKGKNGYDDNYNLTTWNQDINGNAAHTIDLSDSTWRIANGSDTAPLTHGWVRKLEIFTPTYPSWED